MRTARLIVILLAALFVFAACDTQNLSVARVIVINNSSDTLQLHAGEWDGVDSVPIASTPTISVGGTYDGMVISVDPPFNLWTESTVGSTTTYSVLVDPGLNPATFTLTVDVTYEFTFGDSTYSIDVAP